MDAVMALIAAGGAARAGDLLRAGVRLSSLRTAVGAGTVSRAAYGTYCVPGADRAVVAAAALRGQAGRVSACAFWGAKFVSEPRSVHIVVPANRNIDPSRLQKLGLRGVHREAVVGSEGLVEPIELAADHAARCTRPIEQLVIVNSAMRSGILDPLAPDEFQIGTLQRLEWLRRMVGRGSQSVPESVALAVLDAAGLRPQSQVHNDNVGHVDLGVGDFHGIEIDGWETHGTKGAFAEDRRRDRELAARRRWVLRYTYAEVMADPYAWGLDVARVLGLPVAARYDARMRWLMALPSRHLNGTHGWRPAGT